MNDYRQSPEYNRYFLANSWLVQKAGSATVLIKTIPLLGSVMKIKRCPADIDLASVELLAKKHSAILIKIEADIKTIDKGYEPLEREFGRFGYWNSNLPYCPTKTSYIDLARNEGELLKSFDHDARASIKRNEVSGITTSRVPDINEIYPLLEYAGKSQHFIFQKRDDWRTQWEAFGSKAKLLLAYDGKELLGGNLFIIEAGKAFGIFLPLSKNGRQKGAACTLLWEGFKWAKAEGCKIFDLEGIYDARYGSPKAWRGLTVFKRKFRGREVEFMRAKVKARVWYLKPFVWLGLL